eukprot:gene2611-2853_t
MGKRNTSRAYSAASGSDGNARRAPTLKYQEALRIADKNSRTIAKISQLLEIIHLPGYAESDPHRVVEKHIAKLKGRINRRLLKLSKWADSSSDERGAEFRPFQRASTSSRSASNYSRHSLASLSATKPPLAPSSARTPNVEVGAVPAVLRGASLATAMGQVSLTPPPARPATPSLAGQPPSPSMASTPIAPPSPATAATATAASTPVDRPSPSVTQTPSELPTSNLPITPSTSTMSAPPNDSSDVDQAE